MKFNIPTLIMLAFNENQSIYETSAVSISVVRQLIWNFLYILNIRVSNKMRKKLLINFVGNVDIIFKLVIHSTCLSTDISYIYSQYPNTVICMFIMCFPVRNISITCPVISSWSKIYSDILLHITHYLWVYIYIFEAWKHILKLQETETVKVMLIMCSVNIILFKIIFCRTFSIHYCPGCSKLISLST